MSTVCWGVAGAERRALHIGLPILRSNCDLSRQLLSAAVGSALLCFPLHCRSADPLSEMTSGEDWAGYGRTHSQLHYSPLADISVLNVADLGLVWWHDV